MYMQNIVLGVLLILISGPVTWSLFVERNELDSKRLIYLVGKDLNPHPSDLKAHYTSMYKYKWNTK